MKKLYISASLIVLMCLLVLSNCKSTQKQVSKVSATHETTVRHGQFVIEPWPFTVTPKPMQLETINPIPKYPITQNQAIRISFSDTLHKTGIDTTIVTGSPQRTHQSPSMHQRVRSWVSTLVSIAFLVIVIILLALGAKLLNKFIG